MREPIRILVVDDQALFRESLALLLQAQPDLEVVGEAANGEAALMEVARVRPHVVLMDLRMPILDGVAATRRLRAAYPHVQVIALTTFDTDDDVLAALRAGAIGYLLKDVSGATLFDAVRAAARGESWLPPAIATKVVASITRMADVPPVPPHSLPHPLSEREVEVLRLVAAGKSNSEIAATLVVAVSTVKAHINNIFSKLQVTSRTQALVRAHELRIL